MDEVKRCPDCKSEMEEDFIPVRGYDGALRQEQWHKGAPEENKFLGLDTNGIKINKNLYLFQMHTLIVVF